MKCCKEFILSLAEEKQSAAGTCGNRCCLTARGCEASPAPVVLLCTYCKNIICLEGKINTKLCQPLTFYEAADVAFLFTSGF